MALSMLLQGAAVIPPTTFPTESLTTAFVAASFGGGLLPSLFMANKKALEMLQDDSCRSSETALGERDGPCLRSSPLLLYPQPLRVADAVAVAARLNGDVGQLWAEGRTTATGRTPLLRRAEFYACVRGASLPPRWPFDGEGEPIDPMPSVELRDIELSPLAIDACWTALSGGNPYVSKEEVGRQLSRWRPDAATFSLAEFERALLIGRANILLGFIVLFGMQATVVLVLVIPSLLDALGFSATS